MKKALFFLSALSCIIVFSCRKIKPHDLPNNGSVTKLHCVNGIKDADEESIDCGGSCAACTFVTAPCTNTVNNVSFGSGFPSLSGLAFTSAQITNGASGSYYEIEADNGATTLRFTFSSTTIVPNQVFHIVNGTPFSSDEVAIYLYHSGYTFNGSSGDIYLNDIGGKYVLDFCAVNLWTWTGSGYSKTMTGNITTN
ncbi:MAG TPA: hypothetical protein VK177_12405 [Flavobacteriales bacterium]|nr:hypothetical protein [Flavobacteriales bacterium]